MEKIGTKIEFKSGMQYEIIKVWDGGYYDLKALIPQFWFMPDYYPVYYSVVLKNYKII